MQVALILAVISLNVKKNCYGLLQVLALAPQVHTIRIL